MPIKRTYRKKCSKLNRCITKRMHKDRKSINICGYKNLNVQIKKPNDIEKYFNCYNIKNIVKILCNKWMLSGGGCYLQIKSKFCGTIYLTRYNTCRGYLNDHIHILPLSDNSFSWCDKKTRNYGLINDVNVIDNCVKIFKKLLS
jgi:hypothetical protein